MKLRRQVLLALITAGGVWLMIPMGGCAEFVRWGAEWKSLAEPMQNLGEEIVGYRKRY